MSGRCLLISQEKDTGQGCLVPSLAVICFSFNVEMYTRSRPLRGVRPIVVNEFASFPRVYW